MNDHHQQPGKSRDLLEKIRKGDVKMRSRAYFILKIALVVAVAACVLVMSSLIFSYIVFSIGISGKHFLLGFGWHGVEAFFVLFPWGFFVLDVLLLLLLEWLLKEFRFAYHRPILYLFLAGAFLSVAAGMVINYLHVNDVLLQRTEQHELPFLGSIYENVRRPSERKDIFQGVITSIDGNIFTIQANDYDHDADDGMRKVVISPDSQIGTPLKVGYSVFVAGELENEVIHAYGVQQTGLVDED